jgi:hypothetical protein
VSSAPQRLRTGSPRQLKTVRSHGLASPLPDACLGVIDTDRPHQTDTPHVVPAGHAQFESVLIAVATGGTVGSAPGDRAAHVAAFENAYKFGLLSRVDLQLIMKHAEYVPGDHRLAPPGPLAVRAKFNVIEESGLIPAVTLVPWVFVPLAPSQALRGGPARELPLERTLNVACWTVLVWALVRGAVAASEHARCIRTSSCSRSSPR